MVELGLGGLSRSAVKWLSSTPRRTFVLFPLVVIAFEFWRRGALAIQWAGVPLLAWGYLQYRLAGAYRTRRGGGGPGIHNPPVRLVTTGVYRFTRNPMYTGHLIFMLGLVVTFSSWLGAVLLAFHIWWFQGRVLEDEAHMQALFGDEYAAYAKRVRRWGVV